MISWILYLHHRLSRLSDRLVASKDFKTPSYAYIRIMVLNRFKFKQVQAGANVDIMVKSIWNRRSKRKLALISCRFCHCYFQVLMLEGLPSESSYRIAIIGRKEASLTEVETFRT